MYTFKCFTRKEKRSKINDLKLEKRKQIKKTNGGQSLQKRENRKTEKNQ